MPKVDKEAKKVFSAEHQVSVSLDTEYATELLAHVGSKYSEEEMQEWTYMFKGCQSATFVLEGRTSTVNMLIAELRRYCGDRLVDIVCLSSKSFSFVGIKEEM
jgi:hypothetical protein